MALFPEKREGEKIYVPQDTLFTSGMSTRIKLPGQDETVFEEEQAFDQIWLWVIMGIEMVVMLLPLLLTGQPLWVAGIAASVMALTFAFLGSLRLRTRIDEEGVHYQMRLIHWKERTIPWSEIDQVYVREYSPIMEYGGWGIRYGLKGRAYNVKGNKGIQIILKNGKRLLLGTQLPDEASRYLGRHPLLV